MSEVVGLIEAHLHLVSVVVGLKGPGLVEAHILGLIVAKFGEVRVESRKMETRHKFVHELGHEIDVGLIAAGRGVVQL